MYTTSPSLQSLIPHIARIEEASLINISDRSHHWFHVISPTHDRTSQITLFFQRVMDEVSEQMEQGTPNVQIMNIPRFLKQQPSPFALDLKVTDFEGKPLIGAKLLGERKKERIVVSGWKDCLLQLFVTLGTSRN